MSDLSHQNNHRPGLDPYGPTMTAELMRSVNRASILRFIRDNSPVSRSEIAIKLHVSLPTVMRIVEELIQQELVRECGLGESTGGRPSSLLSFNADAYAILAVDVGGTSILATLADLSGKVQQEIRLPRDENTDALVTLYDLIERLLAEPRPPGQRVRGIGVGVPSVVLNPEGIVNWAPSLGWRHLPLKDLLSQRFSLPVFIENDINLAALGEMEFGAGAGSRNLFFISIGRGVGAGVVINGSIYRGHHQAAGEIGYMLPGVRFLGRRYDRFGALESLASAAGIVERAKNQLQKEGVGAIEDDLTAEGIFSAAEAGESWAKQVVDETVDYLSLAIANAAVLLDPEAVVLGARFPLPRELLIDAISERLQGIVPFMPRLLISTLGYYTIVMGAVGFVLQATTNEVVVRRFI